MKIWSYLRYAVGDFNVSDNFRMAGDQIKM